MIYTYVCVSFCICICIFLFFLHQFCKLFEVTLHVHKCDVNLNIQINARQLRQTYAFNDPGVNPQTMHLYGPGDTWEAPRIHPGRPGKHPGGSQEARRKVQVGQETLEARYVCFVFFLSLKMMRVTTFSGLLRLRTRIRGCRKIHHQNPYTRDCLGNKEYAQAL